MTCVSRFVRLLQVHKSFDFNLSLNYASTNPQLNQMSLVNFNLAAVEVEKEDNSVHSNFFYRKGS